MNSEPIRSVTLLTYVGVPPRYDPPPQHTLHEGDQEHQPTEDPRWAGTGQNNSLGHNHTKVMVVMARRLSEGHNDGRRTILIYY